MVRGEEQTRPEARENTQIKPDLSKPENTLSAKTLQGESPLGKQWNFSSSCSLQMQDLQSLGVRTSINQAISASFNLAS